MSKKVGFFEEALESGVSTVKQAGKATAGAVSDTAKAAASQVGSSMVNDQNTDDFVNDLYGSTDDAKQKQNTSAPVVSDDSNKTPQTPEEAEKKAEEKKKLEELKAKLHDEVYYQPLINPQGNKPEERPVEKIEREKQQEMVDLQKKEEKKPPVLVQRNQQRVEKFPGGGG